MSLWTWLFGDGETLDIIQSSNKKKTCAFCGGKILPTDKFNKRNGMKMHRGCYRKAMAG